MTVDTECSHCGRLLRVEVDSSLSYNSVTAGAEPLVFVPDVDFAKLTDPSIIDAF